MSVGETFKGIFGGNASKVLVMKSKAAKALKARKQARLSKEKAKQLKAKPATSKKRKALSGEQLNRLILDHRENGRKLARSLLRRWHARMNPEEVDSIVDITLCEAALRYSPNHGASFMTFFFYHLRGCLVRAVAGAVNATNLTYALAHQPSSESFDNNHASGADSFVYPEFNTFGVQFSESPEQLLIQKETQQTCRKACEQLDELENEVIIRSFENQESLVDIARSLGYSRCHISRVKKKALSRLSAVLEIFYPREKIQRRLLNGRRLLAKAATRRRISQTRKEAAELALISTAA